MASEISLPPLVIQTCSWLCRDHGGLTGLLPRSYDWGLEHETVDVLEPENAKDWTLLECLFQCARRSGIEDVLISIALNDTASSSSLRSHIDRLVAAKKGGTRGLRVQFVDISPDVVRTQGEFMRYLHSTIGASGVLSKGFFYSPLTTHILGASKDFSTLLDFHRSCSKKAPAILSFWPYRASPKSASFAGSHRDVLVTDAKTCELLSLVQINSYEVDSIDWSSKIDMQNERWSPPPESINVRSDLQILDSFFFASAEFLKVCTENFDQQTIREVIENIITSEVKLHTVAIYDKHLPSFKKSSEYSSNICTAYSGVSLATPRNLWHFCISESEINSDAVYMKGKSPHWRKYDNSGTRIPEPDSPQLSKTRQPKPPVSASVVHDSVRFPEDPSDNSPMELKLDNVLIMAKAKIGKAVSLSNSVIGPNTQLGDGVSLSRVIVSGGVSLPVSFQLDGPAFVCRKDAILGDGSLDDTIWVQRAVSTPMATCDYVCLVPKPDLSAETLRALSLDLFPNVAYLTAVKPLLNDASLDPDTLLDALFDEATGLEGGMGGSSEIDDRQRDTNVESISHGSDGSSEGEADNDDEFAEEVQGMLLTVINDKRTIGNMQLELRNYRLGAMKRDVDVLTAILPLVFAKTFSCLTTYVNVNQKFVKENGLLSLVRDFLESGQQSSYNLYYDALLDFVKRPDMIDVNIEGNVEDPIRSIPKSNYPSANNVGADELFVRITCAFGELSHATYLPAWVAAKGADAPDVLKTPHMERYIAFLEESDDESDDDDSSSSCSSD